VRVWDLRKRACAYCLPAHRSLVSAVRWQPDAGHYLLTASYDATIKVGPGGMAAACACVR
jgi:U4/U6 small nuclear ribonucleoprotein PRP4